MKFEEILPQIRKGEKFTDGIETYRYNKRKHEVEHWETDLEFIDGHNKPFWDEDDTMLTFDEILNNNEWEIVKDDK